MLKTVFDTTILVSAFLRPNPGGASFDLLRFAHAGTVDLYLSTEILEETADVLLNRKHLRRRYAYADADVITFCQELARLGTVVGDLPQVSVVRDPNDDMIIATAVVAGADYLVTRDDDLLSLKTHGNINILTPEEFLRIVRQQIP